MTATWFSLVTAIIAAFAAAAAWGNVIWTNRRADARELSKWQREQVMTVVAKVIAISGSIKLELYEGDEDQPLPPYEHFFKATAELPSLAHTLTVIAPDSGLDAATRELREKILAAERPARESSLWEITRNRGGDAHPLLEAFWAAIKCIDDAEAVLAMRAQRTLGVKTRPVLPSAE
ncbi:hypothetical protein HWD35_14420 [Tsukamurella tyrosinosolvens]|mgnify:CR=1 FL=1|uniref:hypothetical protein n=1 Tax=Tsukamurella tyrosinosolvens TaxID=57704 RepID=UPI0007973B0E|nr:hypothetical protein [Tsukamurella tyrosinosolvens]KXP07938.1 hypothetical protein AXK59_01280 [Tsukamurella tyrosinosolvens]KZL97503.1 hypothetical protein AXX05_00605 [Tsukamurella tyrosinosolvens]MCA4995910.1 hypothetical protein [Tsukamurella tyrosinosolvens]RDB47068.1 hypothetical protein DVB87_14950 [Tsukamurella tyrosinosolvens]